MFGDLWRTHRGLFRDACDWAGEVGTVEIRKAGKGAQFLLPSANMPMGIAWARSEPEKDDSLAGVAPRRFPGRMAYHYDTYNFVHPFRGVMVGHSAGSSRAGAAQSQDRARLLSDRSHREMGSRRATSIQSCKIGGIELSP